MSFVLAAGNAASCQYQHTCREGSLPFTGLEVGLVLGVALLFIIGGFLLRVYAASKS